jgi:anti-sigma regulatory factor (Ser/Thr protein kinase)
MSAAQPSWTRQPTSSCTLPFDVTSVAVGRRRLDADMVAAAVEPEVRADVLVVLSELVGNSLRHARPLEEGSVRAMWRIHADEIEVAVADGGAATLPRADRPPFAAVSGRGLGIVDALAESWGVEGAGSRSQLVWAVVSRDSLARHGH